MLTLAEILKNYRKSKKLTQKDMATKLELSTEWYAVFERGTTSMLYSTLIKISELTGISIEKLQSVTENNKIQDLTGKQFGKLKVMKLAKHIKGRAYWLCECLCGNKVTVASSNLTRENTTSCGCAQKDKLHELFKEGTNIAIIKSKRLPANNTSGCKGVSWNKKLSKWQAYIGLQKERTHIGYFDNYEDAVDARKQAEENFYKPIIERNK